MLSQSNTETHNHASALYYITASEIYSNQDKVDDKGNVAFPSHKILKTHYSKINIGKT